MRSASASKQNPLDRSPPPDYTLSSGGTVLEDILVEIVANTRRELAERKEKVPLSELEAALNDRPPAQDFAASLIERKPVAVIAEVKKASPSAGLIRKHFDPVALART